MGKNDKKDAPAADEDEPDRVELRDDYFDASLRLADVQCSVPEQIERDRRMLIGMETFFDNKIHESRKIFLEHSHENPIYLLGAAAVSCLAAILSLEKPEIAKATEVLSATEQFASSLLPRENALVSIGKWMIGSKQPMTNSELRCRVIRAEACLLMGFLQLFQESVFNYIRAGFNLRAAWKTYEQCWSEIKDLSDEERHRRYDYHTVGGILFGMGAINLCISLLPTKILRLVSILGLPHDRAAGFDMLRRVHAGHVPSGATAELSADVLETMPRASSGALRGIRSPLAGLLLAGYYLLIPQFAPALSDELVPEGKAILAEERKLHPGSATHFWLLGRGNRSHRDLRASAEAFSSAARGGVDFVQIVHVNYYELGFNFLFGGEWDAARRFFEVLRRDNSWSGATYCYVLAVCHGMLGHHERSEKLHFEAPTHINRTYGGRTISVEQFVQRRSAAHAKRVTGSPLLDAVELCYLWNGFPQTPFARLTTLLAQMEASERELLALSADELAAKQAEREKQQSALQEQYDEQQSAQEETAADEKKKDDDNDDDDDDDNDSKASTSKATDEREVLLGLYKDLPSDDSSTFDFSTVKPSIVDDVTPDFRELSEQGKLDDLAIHWLIRACLLKELRQYDAAERLYQTINELGKKNLMKSEKYVFPYALFDWASLKYKQGKWDHAVMLLDRMAKHSDFNFEYRLFLRAHLLKKSLQKKISDKDDD